jgi:hypothetical protein
MSAGRGKRVGAPFEQRFSSKRCGVRRGRCRIPRPWRRGWRLRQRHYAFPDGADSRRCRGCSVPCSGSWQHRGLFATDLSAVVVPDGPSCSCPPEISHATHTGARAKPPATRGLTACSAIVFRECDAANGGSSGDLPGLSFDPEDRRSVLLLLWGGGPRSHCRAAACAGKEGAWAHRRRTQIPYSSLRRPAFHRLDLGSRSRRGDFPGLSLPSLPCVRPHLGLHILCPNSSLR